MNRDDLDVVEDVSFRLGQIKSSVVLFAAEAGGNVDLSEALFGVVAQLRDLSVRLDAIEPAIEARRARAAAHA